MTKLKNATQTFAGLDLSATSARLAELRADVARIDVAVAAAEEQRQRIGLQRSENRERGRDGRVVADALLADPAAATGLAAMLAPDLAALDEEFEALTAGIKDLKRRRQDLASQVSEVEAEAFTTIGEAARPLTSALEVQAAELIERLVATYADLAALGHATRTGAYAVGRLSKAVGALLGGSHPIVPWREVEPVSEDLQKALAILAEKVPGLPMQAQAVTYLPLPLM